MTELNKILLNSVPDSWSKQARVRGYYCKSITFKDTGNIFERMEIAESIFKGVVEPSC